MTTPELIQCPAAGRVIRRAVKDGRTPCPVCGRRIQIRGKWDRSLRAFRGQVPKHRRLDVQTLERQAMRTGKTLCQADRELAHLRELGEADRCASTARAQALLEHLPEALRARETDRMMGAIVTVQRACARRKLGRLPRDPARMVRELEEAAAIDLGAVDPDWWIEHLTKYLGPAALRRVRAFKRGRQVYEGLQALIRRARPKTWRDLEDKALPGSGETMLEIARAYPGLEALTLPEHVRALEAEDEYISAALEKPKKHSEHVPAASPMLEERDSFEPKDGGDASFDPSTFAAPLASPMVEERDSFEPEDGGDASFDPSTFAEPKAKKPRKTKAPKPVSHTTSGKPVYPARYTETMDKPAGWTEREHQDAANYHLGRAQEMRDRMRAMMRRPQSEAGRQRIQKLDAQSSEHARAGRRHSEWSQNAYRERSDFDRYLSA